MGLKACERRGSLDIARGIRCMWKIGAKPPICNEPHLPYAMSPFPTCNEPNLPFAMSPTSYMQSTSLCNGPYLLVVVSPTSPELPTIARCHMQWALSSGCSEPHLPWATNHCTLSFDVNVFMHKNMWCTAVIPEADMSPSNSACWHIPLSLTTLLTFLHITSATPHKHMHT